MCMIILYRYHTLNKQICTCGYPEGKQHCNPKQQQKKTKQKQKKADLGGLKPPEIWFCQCEALERQCHIQLATGPYELAQE